MAINKNVQIDKLIKTATSFPIKMVGKRFGRLTITEFLGTHKFSDKYYLHVVEAKCDCGLVDNYSAATIKVGHSLSCGCYAKERASEVHTIHGHASGYKTTRAYRSWHAMKRRCNDPKNNYYHRYGGRGIKVCDRWLNSFEDFLNDMGEPPLNHTLDRYPNKNGNYEPTNCRWATGSQQMHNISTNVFHLYKGEYLCVSDLEKISTVTSKTIRHRINNLGWDAERAITMPPLKGKQTYSKKYLN